MTPYSPERPRGRLVKTDTGYTIEWSAVEKQDEPFNPALVEFRKGEGGEAISGKDRIKASKKRAKQDAKNRKKAAAAAEANRANLNKGADMKEPLITVAKAMVERDYTPRTTTKLAFWKALTALSEKNRQPGQSREQSFAKTITTDTGSLLYRAYRICKNGSEPTSWSGNDEPDSDDVPDNGEGYDRLTRLARKLAGKLGITFEQAFARVYSENRDLAKMDKAHHAQRVAKAMGER